MRSLGIQGIIINLLLVWPLSTESIRFWQINSAIEIKVQKNSPPFQAFKQARTISNQALTKPITFQRTAQLSVDTLLDQNIQSAKKLFLLEPIIVKKFQNMDIHQASGAPLDLSWVNSLPLRQRVRLEEAQSRFAILEQSPEYISAELKKDSISNLASSNNSKVVIVKTSNGYQIKGPWEVSGGLGLINEHSIDLRRLVEGSPREAGSLSIKEGTYNISVASLAGNLIAKMYDKSGNILGQGSLTLQEGFMQAGLAPKLIIRPQNHHFRGEARSPYDSAKNKMPLEKFQAAALKDDATFDVGADGNIELTQVTRNSQTVARFEATEFSKSNMVIIAGQDFKGLIFPQKMMKALKEIVSEQLAYDLNNPDLPVVWGQVLFDGKPVAGSQVELETEQDAKVIYFDILNLPDTNLKETSANGYFAIVGAQPGFQALIARRGGQYYTHNVASLEAGTVSVVNLESTLKTKNVVLRVFDAFTSQPKSADLELQSIEAPLHIEDKGWTSVLLPEISRMSLMQVVPIDQAYLAAQYFYNDDQDFIHAPLISEEWLLQVLNSKWQNIDTEKGTVVGFVQEENFEVYLAGDPDFPSENITYFDSEGKISPDGLRGGGFIINNIEPDTHEIVIYGNESEKISSRLLPIDEKSLSVISFQEN